MERKVVFINGISFYEDELQALDYFKDKKGFPIDVSPYSTSLFKTWLYHNSSISDKSVNAESIIDIYRLSYAIGCSMFVELRHVFQRYLDGANNSQMKLILDNVPDLDIPVGFQGNPGNNLLLRAHCYEYGIGGLPKDTATAYKLYGLSWSIDKNYTSLSKLIDMHLISNNDDTAFSLMLKGASDRRCMRQLSHHYMKKGEFVKAHDISHANWIRNHDSEALLSLAHDKLHGVGCQKDEKLAVSYYKICDEVFRMLPAAYYLGLCYFNGAGVPRDVDEAYVYFHHGYENNHEKSIHAVGQLFENYIKRDDAKSMAFQIYRANWHTNRYVDSLKSLIGCYEKGIGCAKDDVKVRELTDKLKRCVNVIDGISFG